jgi:hypothetical protein
MAKNFLVDRLPPALEDKEENCTSDNTSDNSPLQKITVNTQLKLVHVPLCPWSDHGHHWSL